MKRSLILAALAALALAALLGTGTEAAIPGDVIVASDATIGKPVVMSATDGSSLIPVACGGDLTHGGAPRYFLHAQPTGIVLPGGRPHRALHSYDEDCVSGVKLTNDVETTNMYIGESRWSINGLRVAFGGTRYATDGSILEQGIYVGGVTLDGSGRPIAIFGLRLAVSLPTDQVVPSWSGDNHRVSYDLNLGSAASPQYDIFVADLDTGTATNLTSSSTNEYQPSFSPVANQLAFVRQTSKGGAYRNDVFVLNLDTGKITQVTNKNSANLAEIRQPAWSPDGLNLAFSGAALSIYAAPDIFRIKADGATKAVNLTSSSPDIYYVPLWRK